MNNNTACHIRCFVYLTLHKLLDIGHVLQDKHMQMFCRHFPFLFGKETAEEEIPPVFVLVMGHWGRNKSFSAVSCKYCKYG